MITRSDGKRSAAGRGVDAPVTLTLIHRNNCSNPMGMRVTARFDFPGGVTVWEAQEIIRRRLNIGLPLVDLIARRYARGEN